MIVHRALPADLDQLVPLFDRYRQFYGKPSDPGRARRFLGERLRREESVVFLAVEGEATIGFVQLYPGFSSIGTSRTFVLNDLYVEADHRRTGAGQALVEAATAYARRVGAAGLSLVTGVDNTTAQALYEGLGWTRETAFVEYGLALASGDGYLEDVHPSGAEGRAVG
ncbi:GNAT family N-acetyltransferase [Caulobacter sp. 1776]|uniref:GNAT family N-acetyltransferase n=1 Tax=Caulobacter sp. 1776 TaxID=3156420 RepID=UPI0033993820